MKDSIIYKCDKCGAILVIRSAIKSMPPRCVKCQVPMRKLNEDFDLTEIIEEEK